MRSLRVLLCDTDREYAEAMTEYMIACGGKYHITSCSCPDRIYEIADRYDVSLIGEGFSSCIPRINELSSNKIIYLQPTHKEKDDPPNIAPKDNIISIDKYGSMDEVTSAINRVCLGLTNDSRKRKAKLLGIYSPMRHDLQLPISLTLCSVLSQEGKNPIFIDLEELSILEALIDNDRDLTELLYLQESGASYDIREHIGFTGDFSYLPPMKNLSEIAYITESQWMRLMDSCCDFEYDTVVVLFDHLLQGFENILRNMTELILITKSGEYYKQSEGLFTKYLESREIDIPKRRLCVDLNAANLPAGGYDLNSLMRGNLGERVAEEWKKSYGS